MFKSVIKQFIFILFFASTVLYTEGVSAQGFYDKKEEQPLVPEVPLVDETDSLDYESVITEQHKVHEPSEAQKQYLSQPIERQNITQKNWENAKAGIDYSSDQMKQQKANKPTTLNTGWLVVFELLKWFFIIGAVVLLAYLILRFVGEGNIFSPKSRRITDNSIEIDLTHIEENLDKAELDPLIRQAILAKNYPLAVRLYYLAILKELHLKGNIAWKKDKTNRIYLSEMRENAYYEPFRNTTSVFERVWYGNQTIDENKFSLIQPDFQSLLKSLR